MWLVFRGRDETSPRPADGTIEAIFVDNVFKDPSHSDYWRAASDGRMFLLRGYEEDSERDTPVALEIACLARRRLREEGDAAVLENRPHRDRVRRAVRQQRREMNEVASLGEERGDARV